MLHNDINLEAMHPSNTLCQQISKREPILLYTNEEGHISDSVLSLGSKGFNCYTEYNRVKKVIFVQQIYSSNVQLLNGHYDALL